MALSTEQATDLTLLQALSTHVVGILDRESAICSDTRQLTEANITGLNNLYASVVQVLKDIVDSQTEIEL